MTRIAIVDDYQNVALSLADWKSIPGAEFTVFDKPFANEDEIVAKLQGFEIVSTMRERMEWPQSLFARLPVLKLLCITGLHQRLLDQAAATRHGVVVSHTTAGASVPATVELCVALILDAARNVTREDRDMRAGGILDPRERRVGLFDDRRIVELVPAQPVTRRKSRQGVQKRRQPIAEMQTAPFERGDEPEEPRHGMGLALGIDERAAERHVATALAMHRFGFREPCRPTPEVACIRQPCAMQFRIAAG